MIFENVKEICERAKAASPAVAASEGEARNAFLSSFARILVENTPLLLEANEKDTTAARKAGILTMTATELKNKAKAFCPSVYSARSYIEAITLATEKADGAPIVVCGSLYLASAIRPKLLNFYK